MSANTPDELWVWVGHEGYYEVRDDGQPNDRAVRYIRADTAPKGALAGELERLMAETGELGGLTRLGNWMVGHSDAILDALRAPEGAVPRGEPLQFDFNPFDPRSRCILEKDDD